VGWEGAACCSTKAAISLKRVKIEEKLLWRAYRKSPTLFRTVPSLTPYGFLFLQDWGSSAGAYVTDLGSRKNFVLIFGRRYRCVLTIDRKWKIDVVIFSLEP